MKLNKLLKIPNKLIIYLDQKRIITLPDSLYLKIIYKNIIGEKLNLKNPITFNEKLQWLKLNDRKDIYTTMVDKYDVRKYISTEIGDNYLIPLVGGPWKNYDEINFDKLPKKFVLKCTHDSGGVFICTDKTNLKKMEIKEKMNKHLRKNYYYNSREWPYKNAVPKIIAEEYMVDESGYELKDYKLFCFEGQPKFIQVDFDRFTNHKRNFYNLQWEFQNFELGYKSDKTKKIKRPECLDEMISLSKKLSKNTHFLRVDFYVVRNKVYFGELTFYHGSGFEKFEPELFNEILGSYIDLKDVNNK